MEIEIKIYFIDGQKRTIGRLSPSEVISFIYLSKEYGIEDDKGEIWQFGSARLDLGSTIPHMDIFAELEDKNAN